MDIQKNLLLDDQSTIKKKLYALFSLMYYISSRTELHPILAFLLIFIQDAQLLYYVNFNESFMPMNGIRSFFKFMGFDGVKFTVYYYIQLFLNVFYLVGAAIILFFILVIPPEKYKENIIIKLLRLYSILYNTALLPLFSQGLANSIIIKDGQFLGFPGVEVQSLFLIISIVTLFFYLFIQLFVLPFIYVNPTPFKKKNLLCQTYTFLNLKYNVMIFIFSFITVYAKTCSKILSHFIFVAFFILMICLTYDLLKHQPYYNKYTNNLKSGMWSIALGMSIVNLFAFIIGKGETFLGIMSLSVGFLSFFVGVFLSRYYYKKHTEEIYQRFKAKKIEDKIRYYRDNGIDHSADSLQSSENDSKLISVDSYSESNNEYSKNKNNEHSSEGSESNESDEDGNSDSSSIVLTDRISERITSFGELREIVNEKELNEPIKIFKEISDFELSCRFIWNNETKEAFQLMKELYDESLKQFRNNGNLYVFYSYYLMYIDKLLSKKDKNDIIGLNDKDGNDINENVNSENNDSENNNSSEYNDSGKNDSEIYDSENNSSEYNSGNDNYEEENRDGKGEDALNEDTINANNPNYLLSKAWSLKINIIQRYFIKYLIDDIKEKKKEDKDYYKKEAIERLEKLQHIAVEKHITLLNIFKQFFNNVKYLSKKKGNSRDNFDMDKFLNTSHTMKKETLSLYQKIISDYPDEKSTYQLYTLFMTEIMNQTGGDKYMLSEGDSYACLNEHDNKDKQKKLAEGSSYGGDSEEKRRKMMKDNLIHTFTDKCKRYSKLTIGLFILIIILYVISVLYGFIHISSYTESVKNIQILAELNYNVHSVISRARTFSSAMVLGQLSTLQENLPTLQKYITLIEDQYIPILKKYALKPASENPVVQYGFDSGKGVVESEYLNLNGYELVKNIIVWINDLFNIPTQEWIDRVNSGENILLDYRFRMFAENFKYFYNDVIQETMDMLYSDEIANKNKEINKIYFLTGGLIFLSIAIDLFALTPLYNNSKNLQEKTMEMFKKLPRSAINEIISKFEMDIESITETYDVAIDNKKKKNNMEYQNSFSILYKKFKGVIINILLIVSVLLLTLPIIIKDNSIVKSVNYNIEVGKRKDMVIFMTIFSYEVLVQDRYIYAPGTAEAYLNNEIKRLEKLQNDMYQGNLSLESTKNMRYLDELLLDKKCRLETNDCESIEDRPEISITKNFVILGVNEVIDELIEKCKAILKKSRVKNYKTEDNIYGEGENYINKVINAFNSPEFYFELLIVQHIFDSLVKFDNILYNNIFESIQGTILYLMFITIVGVISITTATIITYRTVIKTNEMMNEIVNIIFVIPTSTINMIPQFKKFVETGSFDEE